MAPLGARANPWIYVSTFLFAICAVVFAEDFWLDADLATVTLDNAWVLHVSFLVFMVLAVAVPSNTRSPVLLLTTLFALGVFV